MNIKLSLIKALAKTSPIIFVKEYRFKGPSLKTCWPMTDAHQESYINLKVWGTALL